MPALLMPRKGCYALIDYEKIFCSDLRNDEDIFALRKIDRRQGCMVIVRPDQHVAQILPLHAFSALAAFFEGFMLPA